MQALTTSPFVKTYSLEEFWKLPEPKDGSKLELIAGVLYMSPPPDFPHNFSSATLNKIFILHLAEIGDNGIVFTPRAALWTSPDTYVEPDLFYISTHTIKQIDITRPNRADLVVEIISPGTAIYDRNTKADTYAALGVRELWLVDPDNQTIEVRNLKRVKKGKKGSYGAGRVFKRGEQVESKVLPKFSPSVSEICRAAPRKSK
jgi:Uma2 family endonuclease